MLLQAPIVCSFLVLGAISHREQTHHHAQLMFIFLVETGFPQFGQAGLKLLTTADLPVSAFQSAGIIGMSHCARPVTS